MKKLNYFLSGLFKVTAFFVILEGVHYLTSCASVRDNTIPTEPTIWIVSEIHQDKRIQNGLVGYKIIPVNQGSVNAKPVWILEFSGKYHVGQRLTFEPISADNATRFR